MQTKICENCGIEFGKKINTSLGRWMHGVKYCSLKCSRENTIFKKGEKPWNNGLKGKGVCKPNSGSYKKGSTRGHRYKHGHKPWNFGIETIYKYICNNCKKEFIKNGSQGGKRISRYCSPQCMYKHKVGENSPRWKGGITSLYDSIRKSTKYVDFRNHIFKRDKYTCQHCGQIGGQIEADHIKNFSIIISENNIKTKEEAYECNELWDEKNIRTLCESCHKKTDHYCGRKLKRK